MPRTVKANCTNAETEATLTQKDALSIVQTGAGCLNFARDHAAYEGFSRLNDYYSHHHLTHAGAISLSYNITKWDNGSKNLTTADFPYLTLYSPEEPFGTKPFATFTGTSLTTLTPATGYEYMTDALIFIAENKYLNNHKTLNRKDIRNTRLYGWYLNINQPNLQLLNSWQEKGINGSYKDSYAYVLSQITVNTSNPALVCKYKFLRNLYKLSVNAISTLYNDVDRHGEIVINLDKPSCNFYENFYINDDKNDCTWMLFISPASPALNLNDDYEYIVVGYQFLNNHSNPCNNHSNPWDGQCP